LDEQQAKLREVMANFALSNARLGEASELLSAAGAGRAGLPVRPLLPFGIEAMNVEMTNVVNGVTTTLKGLMIFSVLPGGAAEQAGLRRGDVIETVNGEETSGRDWPQKFAREPGREATLAVTREGKRITVTLKRPER
jgi:serine protease Do